MSTNLQETSGINQAYRDSIQGDVSVTAVKELSLNCTNAGSKMKDATHAVKWDTFHEHVETRTIRRKVKEP